MIALYTLDSHDYFGPFVNERAAHNRKGPQTYLLYFNQAS
jgi:hypothetical protein